MALGAQTQGKLLDYEQFIDHQLGLTRARIKMTDVLTAGVLLVAAVLGVLFLEVVLDHIFGLPFMLRQIVLILGLSGATVFSALRIVRPLIGRVNGLYAAKAIEETDPAFKNSLINYLELRKHRSEMSRTIMAAIEAKAVDDLTRVEVDTVVNQKRFLQTVYVMCGIVVAFCIYCLMTPKNPMDSIKRAFLSDVARPTNTRLDNIKPGDDPKLNKVVASANVTFSTEVKGARPNKVALHYSEDGGRNYLTRDMTRKTENDYAPWTARFDNVQQSIEYYLTAEDAVSRTYHLEVLPEPVVVSVQHDLDFPAYTRVPRRPGVEGGNVEAIEGTIVTVRARTNEPADSAWIMMIKPDPKTPNRKGGTDQEKVNIGVSETDAHELVGKFKVTSNGQYMIKFKTTGGQENPNAAIYDIKALKDNPPQAQIVRPDRPAIKAPSNSKVAIRFKASDDYGVKEATLRVHRKSDAIQKSDEILQTRDFLERKEPTRELVQDDVLDLAALRVKPGATIEYWVSVRDTREPLSNKVETQRQTIEVTAPASKDELQKIEQQNKPDEPPPAEKDDPQPPDAGPKKDQPDKGENAPSKDDPNDGNKGGDPRSQPDDKPQDDPKDNPNEQDKPLSDKDRAEIEKISKALAKQNPQPPSTKPGGKQANSGNSSGANSADKSQGASKPNSDANPPAGTNGNDPSKSPRDPSSKNPDNTSQVPPSGNDSKSSPPVERADKSNPSDGKQADGKQADAKSMKPADGKQTQADGKQADGKQADGKQADGKQADSKQAQADGKQADSKQAQADGKQADGKQSDGKQAQADGKQADGKQVQADGKQADGKQADGKQADGKQ
ncbi:MAG: hypothetical protein JWN86_3287, partial [Planctomycetota bacterium]|nr:hypothetical protein [Planctomycetota bacterium]